MLGVGQRSFYSRGHFLVCKHKKRPEGRSCAWWLERRLLLLRVVDHLPVFVHKEADAEDTFEPRVLVNEPKDITVAVGARARRWVYADEVHDERRLKVDDVIPSFAKGTDDQLDETLGVFVLAGAVLPVFGVHRINRLALTSTPRRGD